jgi:hypothetical protein
MRMLRVLLGIGLAIGFGALAQTASQTPGTSQSASQNPQVLPQSRGPATPQDTAIDQSDLGTGGSGDGGMRHRGKHMGDAGMRHHGKHTADAGM